MSSGGKVSMLMFIVPDKDYGELRFVEVDFTSSTATAVLIYSENIAVHLPHTVFMGSNTISSNSITIYESYTVGSASTFETSAGI